jgi:opacity protein-like surface antigen
MRNVLLSALVLSSITPLSLAQQAASETAVASEPPVGPATRLDQLEARRDFWQVDVKGSASFGADGKQSGDVDVARFDAGIAYNTSLRDDLRLRVSLSTQQTNFDFSDVTTVVPGTDDPWDHLQAYRLGGSLFGRVNETWSWFGGLEVRAAFESGADIEDSLEIRGTGGAEYRVNEDLAFTFGLAAGTQIEDDAIVIPLLGIDWNIDEKTRLVSRDLGLILSYEIAPDWSVGVFGNFEIRDWRLDDSRATIPDGVARERRIVTGIEARYRPSNKFEFALEGGVVAWQKLKALDDDGRKVGDQDFEPAPYIGASLVIRF